MTFSKANSDGVLESRLTWYVSFMKTGLNLHPQNNKALQGGQKCRELVFARLPKSLEECRKKCRDEPRMPPLMPSLAFNSFHKRNLFPSR